MKASKSLNRPISFLLNGVEQYVTPDSADTTLLNWLRRNAGLKGSKEGCAEGDCGSCSIVVSRLTLSGEVSHHAANACIFLLPMVDGLVITTVEYVAASDDVLHPVQTAMVDYHGSQCGFCTPGFIMSLLAGWRSNQSWQRQDIEDLLAGNLCRCTGYGPIIAAAESLAYVPRPEWEAARLEDEKNWLAQHQPSGLSTQSEQVFLAPTSTAELSQAVADNPQYQIIAGGTDIGLWITKKHQVMDGFISVMRVPELTIITEDKHSFTIPAGVSHAAAKHALGQHFPALDELWRRFGSAQVRATGTVCGNIANGSPIGDLPPAFLALDAVVVVQKGDDERQIPLKNFFLGYQQKALTSGEWVKAIIVPKMADDCFFSAIKISRRFDQDISALMGGFWFKIDDGIISDARIGFGGMAAIPKRAYGCEAALVGHRLVAPLSEAIIGALAGDFTPINDVRASAQYRQKIAFNLLQKAIEAAAKNTAPLSLAGSGVEQFREAI